MSTLLSPLISDSYISATNLKKFFNEKDIRDIENFEKREQAESNDMRKACNANLFFGFFFDGTCNNYELAAKTGDQSNVARMYDIFPGRGVPKVLDAVIWKYRPERYNNFFRVYIPGVSSPFDQVNDSGKDWMKTLGGSVGYKGGDRIVWALIQAINNVNRYFHGQPLLLPQEATALATSLSLSREARDVMTKKEVPVVKSKEKYVIEARIQLEKLLRRLHASVSAHWAKNGAPPAKKDPGIVKRIHISIFGFSRGATQARAFTNWLDSLCRLDALVRGEGTSSLGGFPVEFDFLGVFDTVASVGPGNTLGNLRPFKAANGHGAWADAEDSLRIPGCVKRCVHLVAGHELRRSFPSDSIAVGSVLPAGASEFVFPGVHSDVGGGYEPKQQGKGVDPSGADMLSRIPLLFMYKQARLAGVPLKLELADKVAQNKFSVAAQMIENFNAYLSACKKKTGSLTDIIREQAILQMAWRYSRRENGKAPLHKIQSYLRATNFDKSDLLSANSEYNDELRDFEKSILKRGKEAPRKQSAGFENEVSGEWEEIACYWPFTPPQLEVTHFFDEYVHDSRSAFKLYGQGSEAEAVAALREWSKELRVAKVEYKNASSILAWTKSGPPNYGMNPNERIAAEEYDKIRAVPVYINEGREPYAGGEAGYFRFRKIYGGSDSVLLSNWMPADGDRGRALANLDDSAQDGTHNSPPKAA
ncbi:T6SS phospholipase effector Tle1-like catalytic domain-containing protein [Massilia sp. CMS3.1]|uniref:T6SS phospholipase effector Tle1-like catalytic domain-containing protein n=1 Tax=Massilia sp. CMS3.1 TaxID=3373083 RepID=UPI003EE46E7F